MVWRSPRRWILAFAITLAAVLTSSTVNAGSGSLDSTFNGDGRAVVTFDPSSVVSPESMAIDSQGRIVVAGSYSLPGSLRPLVARFNPDGSLDPSFGGGGVMELPWGSEGRIHGVAIDEAGRIVLGGIRFAAGGSEIAVARLLDNGETDRTFAGDGLLTFNAPGTASGHTSDLTLDDQGRILLTVSDFFGPPEFSFAVARVTDSGALDSSFSEDGIAGVNFGAPSFAEAVAVDAQGRVLAAGSAGPLKAMQFAVARFDDEGRPDPSFDGDGKATPDSGPDAFGEGLSDMALDAQERLVLLGRGGGIQRLLTDGSRDLSFGRDGSAQVSAPNSFARGVAVEESGRILVVGNVLADEGERAFLARLRPNGARDPWFGAGGSVRESFLASSASGEAVSIDSAGRYLVTGALHEPRGIGLARYLGAQGRCRGTQATLVGTSGRDTLQGTRRRDVIVGLGGNDRIRGFGAGDLVCAGRGSDLVRAGRGNDKVFGGLGNDRLFGQIGKDRLRGGRGDDRLAGGPGRDSLR